MTIDNDNLLNSILESLDRIQHINADDIPNIDLYMDQVTTFMDKRLRRTTRNPDDDKIMTKTMINNYAKNNLLPSPIKKKYSKEHILVLLFIYYFKGIMSIGDIETILKPITNQFFGTKNDFNLEEIYTDAFKFSGDQIDEIKKDIVYKYEKSEEMFSEAPKKSKDFLKKFAFICMLSYDVYVKKLLIEKIVDGLQDENMNREMTAKKNEAKKAEAAKKAETVKKAEAAKKAEASKKAEAAK